MKLEQVAYACRDIEEAMGDFSTRLGLGGWITDTVDAEGIICGRKGRNRAQLAFNYDLGFELELIQYVDGPNWHKEILDTFYGYHRVFPSHCGYHCENIEEERKKYLFPVAQEITTFKHTNPIAQARKYKYLVFYSRPTLGFDLKLIQRINKDAA